ncbi:MAG: glycerol-3-phosphate acyltransferase, partial [Myxococcales bacterium]
AIVERPAFQGTVAQLAWELGSNTAAIGHRAASDLADIAATHSPYTIDLAAQFCRLLYTRGYASKLDYDRRALERIYELGQRNPVVFLPSHRSNLDHLVLQYALYENGHPPNHTAGGDNMNFPLVGPMLRRSGVFFIRRTFKDDDVYKRVLGHYIDYLVEKRFPLEWYIEGGRSRSGKLLPPRFGMLAYVADAYRRGKSEDVCIVPVSIVYDQIQDAASYAAEQRGGDKEREGLRWFLRVVRSLHRRYGGIHIRFGEPLSLREMLGDPEPGREPNADERSIDLQKIAFEVAVQINRATPITPTSLVTLAMLGALDRALTVEETMAAVERLLEYTHKRQLPLTENMDCTRAHDVQRTLDELVENNVVSSYTGGSQAVYAISPDQHLTAAYYRNSVIHFFVVGAIAELALLAAAAADVSDRVERFWDETLALRDLFKFEFFFADKDEYRREVRRELTLHDSEWERAFHGEAVDVRNLLLRFRPFHAHLLRPFLEAYSVVADALVRHPAEDTIEDRAFLAECLGLGQQYHLQKRLRSAESVSNVLFATALGLARHRGVVQGAGDVAQKRKAFAAQIRDAIRRVDAIEALAASRRAGLID